MHNDFRASFSHERKKNRCTYTYKGLDCLKLTKRRKRQNKKRLKMSLEKHRVTMKKLLVNTCF